MLDLSLSLCSSRDHQQNRQVQLDIMPASTQSSVPKESLEMAARQMLRGIDVNRAPAVEKESEVDAVILSSNSTLSIVSGRRDHAMTISNGSKEMISYEEDGKRSRKKLRLSKDQYAVLEESFKELNTLNPKQKQKKLG